MYKYNSGLLPTIFYMFKLNQDVYSYNTRQSTQIHISMATVEIRLRSVRIKGGILELFEQKTQVYFLSNTELQMYI